MENQDKNKQSMPEKKNISDVSGTVEPTQDTSKINIKNINQTSMQIQWQE